ncbi:DsbA family protein [Bradyrhizobium sp. U531]|uniref:DsbA family protein n=1 Tax=Bradyrhizobium sp. U531 TaxID=3053458 RepID=UPI003F68618F
MIGARPPPIAAANGAGYDGKALLEAASMPEARQEYAANTPRALEAGVFGSPFYVFDGERFWGPGSPRDAGGSLDRGQVWRSRAKTANRRRTSPVRLATLTPTVATRGEL